MFGINYSRLRASPVIAERRFTKSNLHFQLCLVRLTVNGAFRRNGRPLETRFPPGDACERRCSTDNDRIESF